MPDSIRLLKRRRFLPFFVTQFLGAFNDNLYKNGLVIYIAFQTANMTQERVITWLISPRGYSSCHFFCSRQLPGSSPTNMKSPF
jgi:hypothetical protein